MTRINLPLILSQRWTLVAWAVLGLGLWSPAPATAAPTAPRAATRPARTTPPARRTTKRAAPTPRKATTPPRPRPKATQEKPGATLDSQAMRALFAKANKLYNESKYGEAALLFQKLATQRENFAVFYNLGNSYFRLQHYGKALAYYRKAQRLQPNHMDLLHNIQLLYKRTNKDEKTIPQLRVKFLFWYYLLNLKQLFYLVILLTYLLLLAWAVRIRRNAKARAETDTTAKDNDSGQGTSRWVFAGLVVVLLVLWTSLGLKLYREEVRQVGVVTTDRVTARSGYGSHFEPLFQLSEADEVLIKERIQVTRPDGRKEPWLRVEIYLPDKQQKRRVRKRGWIPGKALQQI